MTDILRMASAPMVEPNPTQLTEEQAGPSWKVMVYDNSVNTYEEVITVLMIATACTPEDAYIEAWEIDHYGQCCVHRADEGECQDVADIIATIGIKVEAIPEN